MLKITYLESGLLLEHLPIPVETWIARRTRLTTRSGGPLSLQPSHASLLLPCHLPGLASFQRDLQRAAISVDLCDRTHLEITLSGVWVTEDATSHEGIFLVSLEPARERQLLEFWQLSQSSVACDSAQIGI